MTAPITAADIPWGGTADVPRALLAVPAGDDALEPSPVVTGAETWPSPDPLAPELTSQPYPLDVLPDGIRHAITEVADEVQAPIGVVACSALGALSLAGQALADVQRDDGLNGPCSLAVVVIADSGERKSTCDKYFMRAIRTFEAEQDEYGRPRRKAYAAALATWQAQHDGITAAIREAARKRKDDTDPRERLAALEQQKPNAPRIPRLVYGDVTSEQFGYQVATGWPSAGIMSAEAGAVLGAHAMSADSVMRTLAQWNLLWDGAPIQSDRRTVDSWSARGARLTVCLAVQPATWRTFVERTGALARGIGFLPRCLLAWPATTQGRRFKAEDQSTRSTWPALDAFDRRLTALLRAPVPMDAVGTLTPPILTFSGDARRAWIDYYNSIETLLGPGRELADVRDVANRAADNAARLAALFHLFAGADGAIGLNAVAAGVAVVSWHLHEARRILGDVALTSEQADAVRLDAWLLSRCRRDGITSLPKNTVRQYGPLRDGARLDAAIETLTALARVRPEGRPATLAVNPALLEVSPVATAIPAIPATDAVDGVR